MKQLPQMSVQRRFKYASNLKLVADTRAVPAQWCWNASQLPMYCTLVTRNFSLKLKLELSCQVGLLGCQQTSDGQQGQC